MKRAQEEVAAVDIELKGLLDWYKEVHTTLEAAYQSHTAQDTPFHGGAAACIYQQLVINEMYQKQLQHIIIQHFGQNDLPINTVFLETLAEHLASQMPMLDDDYCDDDEEVHSDDDEICEDSDAMPSDDDD